MSGIPLFKTGKAIEADALKSAGEERQFDIELRDYGFAVQKLQEAKAQVRPFVDAFLKGGLDNIVPVVREFDRQQEKEYANALSSLECQKARDRGEPEPEPPI